MSAFNQTRKSFTLSTGKEITYYSLAELEAQCLINTAKLPFSIKVLLESLLRMQSHEAFTEEHISNFCKWSPKVGEKEEFPYMPSRVLLQDFTGVPCVVDLAAGRGDAHPVSTFRSA